MYFLIISFGFFLAMRGARPAPLQRPGEGLRRIGRETKDFFLITSLILTLLAVVATVEKTLFFVNEYKILFLGIAAYMLSRFQKKNDVFFLSVVASVFMISSKQHTLWQGIFLAGAVSAGIALFQACFLGLRYKLLFSHVPASMKGWPILCLLAGFISIVLWCLRGLAF
jgi:hypothetical protein